MHADANVSDLCVPIDHLPSICKYSECAGHAEPAAGTIGIVHAAEMLMQQRGGTLPHLRSLNPHIASLLSDDSKSRAGTLALPRQAAGRITEGPTTLGVSAFAFQVMPRIVRNTMVWADTSANGLTAILKIRLVHIPSAFRSFFRSK